MSDTTDIKTLAQQDVNKIVADTKSQLSVHRTLIIGVLATVALLYGFTVYMGVKSYDKQLATANAQYAQLQQKNKADEDLLKTHTETRATQTAQVQMTQAIADDRDKKATLLKAEVVVANATDAQVQDLATKYLHQSYTINSDGSLSFQKTAVQKFVATQIDDDTVTQDKVDLQTQVVTLTDEVGSLQSDLATSESDKAATEKVLVQYKKAAIKSKWRKTLDVTEKVGLFAAGALVVYEVKK